MPILPRYCLRIFLPVFLLCLGVFTGVLLMNHFLRLFNLAVMKGISFFWILACFARLLPFFLSLAVPMSFLVALMLTLGQLSETGEVTALRASGFSFREITWPFVGLGFILSLALFFVNHKASPDGFHSFRKRYVKAAQQLGSIDLQPQTFLPFGVWRLYAEKVDQASGAIEGAYLVRPGRAQPLRVSAPRGSLRLEKGVGLVLELEDGSLQLPNEDPQTFTSAKFTRYRVFVPLAGALIERAPDIQELDSFKLMERVRDPKTPLSNRLEYTVEVAVRSAGAFSPFIFFWIAAPLGLRVSRNSKATGFGISLAILFGFYGLLAVGIGLGRRNEHLSSAAPWMADAAGLIVGAALTRRAVRQ